MQMNMFDIHPYQLLAFSLVLLFLAVICRVVVSNKTKRPASSELEQDEQNEELSVSKLLEDGRAHEDDFAREAPVLVSREDGEDNGKVKSLSPDENFELEKRAVFSKTWLCVSHAGRFTKPGDYHSVEFAGFSIFVILGKDLVLRAFHNVCRHRAYTVLRKDRGSSLVLGCKYHGWSYSSKGELIKAPQFETVEGFDKSQNGLFGIHTQVTDDGLVFVNMDGNKHVLAPDFRTLDEFASRSKISKQSKWIMGWAEEIPVDWKVSLNIDTQKNAGVFETLRQVLQVRQSSPSKFNLFPGTILKKLPNDGWASVSLFPVKSGLTSVRCDIYHSNEKEASLGEKGKIRIKSTMKAFISDLRTEGRLTDNRQLTILSSDTRYRFQPLLDLHRALEEEKRDKVDPSRRYDRDLDENGDNIVVGRFVDGLRKLVWDELKITGMVDE